MDNKSPLFRTVQEHASGAIARANEIVRLQRAAHAEVKAFRARLRKLTATFSSAQIACEVAEPCTLWINAIGDVMLDPPAALVVEAKENGSVTVGMSMVSQAVTITHDNVGPAQLETTAAKMLEIYLSRGPEPTSIHGAHAHQTDIGSGDEF